MQLNGRTSLWHTFPRKCLLPFVVGRTEVLKLAYVHHLLLPQHIELLKSQAGHHPWIQSIPSIVVVLKRCYFAHPRVKQCRTGPIVLCIQGKSIHLLFEVIPDNVKLVKATVECFGSGDIVDISQPKDIIVLFMLESLRINIEEAWMIGEPSFGKVVLRFGWHEGVEALEGSFF